MRVFCMLFVLCAATPVGAQSPDAPVRGASLAEAPRPRFTRRVAAPGATRPPAVRQSRAAFPIEFLGGTAGSLIGLGASLLIASPDECNNEDLACILERIGLAGLLSAIGAPTGTMLAGGWADTRPSLLGAAVGSVAGVAAGAGLLKLTEEIGDGSIPVVYALALYGGSHGLLTAAGSRVGALLRN